MKIEFIPFTDPATNFLEPPSAAIKNLPQWYKIKRPTVDGKKPQRNAEGTGNISVKWCNPFGDALGGGYQLVLDHDLQVLQTAEGPVFTWGAGGDEFVGAHSKEQISKEMIPTGFSDQPFKFTNGYLIRTPAGHSALFTHPLNRPELPFHTLAGIVETDSYELPVNFPFLIRSDFEGIIPRGTPIVSIIPFKRESWEMKIEEFSLSANLKAQSRFRGVLFRPYKTMFWKQKQWR